MVESYPHPSGAITAPWTRPNKEFPTRTSSSDADETQSVSLSEYSSRVRGMKDTREEDRKAALLRSIRGKLFEREEQQERLLEAYRRCFDDRAVTADGGRRREVVLITGSAGTGKSALARATLEAAIQATSDPKPFLLWGKCDQMHNSEPLAPFVQAFTQFVEDVVERDAIPDYCHGSQRISESLRAAIILAAKDSDIELLTDMIPAFWRILSTDSTTSDLAPLNESTQATSTQKKRTNRTRANAASPGVAIVCRLLQELCASEIFRIVLLIDDLQWLDANSVQMFGAVASIPHSMKNFLLIGTCRGDDVAADHELPAMLRRLEHPDQDVKLTDIQLGNLRRETVSQMLAEWLQVENPIDVLPVAELTHQLSDGNPFCIVEQVRSLVEKKLLFSQDGKWKWEESEVLRHGLELGRIEISDVLVQSAALRGSGPTSEALQIAACLGTEFTIAHVCLAATCPSEGISSALNDLLAKELIMPTAVVGRLRWAHDKFQQSAFSLIPEDDRDLFLYSVGKRLHERLPEEDLISHIFLIVNLLCQGTRFFQNEEEHEQVAGLLSIAGTKAAQASAFKDAASYFRKGIDLLPPGHWERDTTYALSQQLYNFSAEMEACLGNARRVDELVEMILNNSRCLQDQLRAYDTQIYSLSSRNEQNKSIQVGLDVLRKLGESVPRSPGVLLNIKELITTTRVLRRVTAEDVLSLRPLRNWKKAAVLQIILLVFPSILRCQPDYALFLVAKAIKLTMRHGLTPTAGTMFSAFGMMVCHPVGFVEEGCRYEEIGWRICEKYGSTDLFCRIYLMRFAYVKPWRDSMRACLPGLVTGASSGMATGDFEMAFINCFEYSMGGLLSGLPLREHYDKMLLIKQQFVSLGQETVMFYLNCVIQLAENLLGRARDVTVLLGEIFDAQQALDESIAINNATGVSYIFLSQIFLALFTNQYQEAVRIARKLQNHNNISFGANEVQYSAFMTCLAEVIAARETKSRGHVRAGDLALRRLKRWTRYAPDGWRNRIYLIEAERDALRGRHEAAIRNFFSSVEFAERHCWVHEQALALERAGIFLLEVQQMSKALECLYRARDLYETWGCVVKCNIITELISERVAAKPAVTPV
jgi:histidine kinase